jgi:hypothetical protein
LLSLESEYDIPLLKNITFYKNSKRILICDTSQRERSATLIFEEKNKGLERISLK